MNINLHIERLVLDGIELSSRQIDLLQTSLTNELTQMFARGELAPKLAGGASLKSVAAESISMSNKSPQLLGQKVAHSVYGGIGNE